MFDAGYLHDNNTYQVYFYGSVMISPLLFGVGEFVRCYDREININGDENPRVCRYSAFAVLTYHPTNRVTLPHSAVLDLVAETAFVPGDSTAAAQ